jgi:hypothetical protein
MLTGCNEWGAECLTAEEAEEMRLRCKHRALGNIKFIGCLLARRMVASKLLLTLCNELMASMSVCADALECLAALLTLTGPVFDTDNQGPLLPQLAFVFGQVQELIADRQLPSRIRFLLRDVLEKCGLRNSRKDRKREDYATPGT